MSPAAGVSNLIRVSNACSSRIATRCKLLLYSDSSRLYHHQSNQRHNPGWISQKQQSLSSPKGYGPLYSRLLSTTNSVKDNMTPNKPKPLKYTPPEPSDIKSKPGDDGIRPGMTFTEVKAEALKRTTGGLGVRGLIKKYGLPFTIYYSTLYFGGMGCCYLALESGLVGEAGVLDWVQMTPIADYVDLSRIDPKHGNIAGAIVINEILELIRLPFAILTIPYIKAAWDRRKAPRPDKP